MKKRIRRVRGREEILEILEQFHACGLTQAAFADKRDVAVSSLQLWLRKEREGKLSKARKSKSSAEPPQLVPVKIVDPPMQRDDSLLEFELTGGGKLRFSATLSAEALARYAEALGHRCQRFPQALASSSSLA